MAERKYEKCFNTESKAGLKLPPYRHDYDFIKHFHTESDIQRDLFISIDQHGWKVV